MSYTFSRRDFLKYSALTVVAVAGAGMLSGCEIQDPNNPVVAVGKKASMKAAHWTATLSSVSPMVLMPRCM
jgi:anaerobic selenocysteine-containing dehydrogenase